MYYLPPTIPIIQIQMANDKMKVAWSPPNKKAKPPKKVELKNWQRQHLSKYKSMLEAGMLTREEYNKHLDRHKIPSQFR